MPEYLLYVKEDGLARQQAFITPCFELDKHFWEQADGRRLHIIGKSPSLAIAFMLREQVNQRLEQTRMNEDGIAGLKKLAHSAVRESTVMYGRAVEEPGEWFHFASGGGLDEQGTCLWQPGLLAAEAGRLHRLLAGRALLWEEVAALWQQNEGLAKNLPLLVQWLVLQEKAAVFPGVRLTLKKGLWRHRLVATCERCGETEAIHLSFCHRCGQGCGYCRTCIRMGLSKCCTVFVCAAAETGDMAPSAVLKSPQSPAAAGNDPRRSILQWEGTFTPWQAEAAERARRFATDSDGSEPSFLLWAVCGAGKTELLFPAIADTIAAGKKVLVATPRKDVVLELAPRLQRVFPAVKVIAVHGTSGEKWEEAGLVVSTTHQVMRFYQRFPLVVVDEADAFPYHGNPMLYRAVQRAAAAGGKQLYLTATPPKQLRQSLVRSWPGCVTLHSRTHTLLPQRYHGHPLPIPTQLIVPGLQQKLRKGQPLSALLQGIRQSLKQARRVFVFVPRVADVDVLVTYLSRLLPDYAERVSGVHAADPQREEKVSMFRDKKLSLLVTTTILERGVTIPESDCIVCGADNPVFDQASLIQIAGRVGRSAAAPGGLVLFLAEKRAQPPRAAIREIKRMNRLAQKLHMQGGSDAI